MNNGHGSHVNQPIIVSGMYRSGTSIAANVVHAWGAFGGDPDQLAKGDPRNPRGYWQNHALERFCAQLFSDIGVDYWHESFSEIVRLKASVPRYRNQALALISQMQSVGRIWFWKEPKLTVLLPFWKRIWPAATHVITLRNPFDSALSWQKFALPRGTHGRIQAVAAALLSWQAMMLSLMENTEDSNSKYFVVYEQLVNDPQAECRRLAEFLCREYQTQETVDTKVPAMVAAVDPGLRRLHTNVPFDEMEIATEPQKALYKFLLTKAADPTARFDRNQYPFYAGWREYLDNLKLLRTVYDELHRYRAVQAVVSGM
jgi:hypothetical protein